MIPDQHGAPLLVAAEEGSAISVARSLVASSSAEEEKDSVHELPNRFESFSKTHEVSKDGSARSGGKADKKVRKPSTE